MSVLFKALQAPVAGAAHGKERGGKERGGKEKPPGRAGAVKAAVPPDPAAHEFAAQALPGGYLRRKRRRRLRIALFSILGGLALGSSALIGLEWLLKADSADPADWPVIGPLAAALQPPPEIVPPLSERLADRAATAATAEPPPPPATAPGRPAGNNAGADAVAPQVQVRSGEATDGAGSASASAAATASSASGASGRVRVPMPKPPAPAARADAATPLPAPPSSLTGESERAAAGRGTRVQHDGGVDLAAARSVRIAAPGAGAGGVSPGDRLGTHRRAHTALRAGKAEQAAALYRRLLSENPNDTTALFGLATALQRLGRGAEAQQRYQDLLAREPNNAPALSNLIALIGGREPAAALVQFEALALDFPETPAIQAQLSRLYARTGRENEALGAARRAVEIAPENVFYQHNLAVLLDTAGRSDAAAAAYRAVLDMAAGGDAAGQALPLDKVRARLRYLAQ